MGLPSGVSTATVTFGTDADVLGVGATTTLTITPSHTLIWAATGEIIRAFSVSVDAAAGVVGSFAIPHTDQAGFTDELGNAITNWYYTVAGLVARSGETQPYRKVFQVASGVTSLNLDLIPVNGTVGAVGIAPQPVVLAVNGRTGAVVTAEVDGDGKLLESQVPVRLSDANLQSTIGARIDPKNIVMPAGLVSFWDFTEPGAPFVAKQGATQASLIDLTSTPVAKSVEEGPFGPMAQITLASQLRVPAALLGALNLGKNSGTATVAGWFSRENRGGTAMAGIWRENGGDTARQYALWCDLAGYGGDSKVIGHVSRTGGESPKVLTPGEFLPYSRDLAASRRQIADNDLRFWAMTYDGRAVRVYIDGVMDSYTAYTEPGAPNGESLTYDKNPYIGPTNSGWTDGLNDTPADFLVGVAVPETNTGRGVFKTGGIWVFDRALPQVEIMSLYVQTKPFPEIIKLDQVLPSSATAGTKYATRLVAMSRVRGPGASTTSPDNQTWYAIQASGGLPHLVYDDAVQAANATTRALVYADWLDSIPVNQVKSITFDMLNKLTASKVRIAIRIGDRWHVSNTEFSCATTHTDNTSLSWESFTLTMNRAAANWRRLTVTPDGELTMGSALQLILPLGKITGIGVYTGGSETGGVIRVRNIKINGGGVMRETFALPADPEPSLAYAYPGATASFDVADLPLGARQTWTSIDGSRSFSAATLSASPSVVIDENGRRVLRFDDSNDLMDLMWSLGVHSFGVVYRFRAIEASAPIMASPATGQVNLIIGNPTTNYALSAGTSLVPSPAIAPDTNRHRALAISNTTSSVIRIDGTRQVGNAGSQTRTGFRLGATSGGVACPIDVERVDIWDTAIDSTTEAAWAAYFA